MEGAAQAAPSIVRNERSTNTVGRFCHAVHNR